MKPLFIILVSNFIYSFAQAQQFLPEMEFLSTQKSGYAITKAGQRIIATLDKIHRKKGAIEDIAIKMADGTTAEYNAIGLQEMGFPTADVAKEIALKETMGSVFRAKNSDIKQVGRDTVLFYHEYLDDQKRDVLLQLLNPGFDRKIRVYHDPSANQTSGAGVGPIMITGRLDKSYYIRKNNTAYRIRKGDYEAEFKKLYGDCPTLSSKYPASA